MTIDIQDWLIADGYKIIVIVGLAILSYVLFRLWGNRIIQTLSKVKITRGDRTEQESKLRLKTLSKVVARAGAVVILALVVLMVLQSFGIDITPVLAGAGVVGIAVGFGAQSLIKDILNGFFILLEDQFVEGDFVLIKGMEGTVEDFSLRRTILRDFKGDTHIIPNSQIKTATNYTHGWSRVVATIPVTYEEDTEKIFTLLEKIGGELAKDEKFKNKLMGSIEVLGVDDFTDVSLNISVAIKTVPSEQWEVKRELLKRIKLAFDEEGIEISHRRRAVTK
ncbi:mechanosensitive ion channel family protein [Patescibacteria group bacterium]|nr:mechanosensitive ion channel family protein [Patescibacteria group bacterium]